MKNALIQLYFNQISEAKRKLKETGETLSEAQKRVLALKAEYEYAEKKFELAISTMPNIDELLKTNETEDILKRVW